MSLPQPPGPFGGGVAAARFVQHQMEESVGSADHPHPDNDDTEMTPTLEELEKNRHEAITALARSFSGQSEQHDVQATSQAGINTFLKPAEIPELDPFKSQFNPEMWVKNLLAMQARDPARYPRRTAGVTFRNLAVSGYGTATDYQMDFANVWLKAVDWICTKLGLVDRRKVEILHNFEGIVNPGEMVVVLGRPGSGCSTLLKTLAGETHGLVLEPRSDIQYDGVPYQQMHQQFRGEVIYQAETEVHFPHLTVGQTLLFAAHARAPRNRLPWVTRDQYAVHMRDVTMAMLGLAHTMDTKVGSDFVRGVSGGERKRVSIAEIFLCGSPVQCWDNSTRGLDSATALEFVRNIRLSTQYSGTTALVAIYQASQAIYDVFDKVMVLYQGHQIYFGKADTARQYFIDMGYECPERQTTADFLTSLTNPTERRVRPGFERTVPRTPQEFVQWWDGSRQRQALIQEIEERNEAQEGGRQVALFTNSRAAQKAKGLRERSPYTISYPMQVRLCLWRGFLRLRGNPSLTFSAVIGNTVMGIIIGTVFLDLPSTSDSFFQRGSLLFFAILLNAFASSLEILTLWEQRPIVEKQFKYALYHPSAEAISSYIVELPSKVLIAIAFNFTVYFVSHLRRTPSHFFIFFLFSFTTTLAMSNLFRTIGAISRSPAQAMVPAGIFMMILVIYTGFTIPVKDMHPWFRWLNYLNPIAYSFESLMINEFSDRQFPCSTYVPGGPLYANAPLSSKICAQKGAVAGQDYIDGDAYINTAYHYYRVHLWRNLGILWAFLVLFLITYLVGSEYIRAKPSRGEVLVFPRGKLPDSAEKNDPESGSMTEKEEIVDEPHEQTASLVQQTAMYHWQDVSYQIKVKGGMRTILDGIDGWVKPGTLTALMGVTGAGKTSLLDVLANRITTGTITGEMLVNGRQRDGSFQRKTGYVQQQDLHLETSTVREALAFSALLRQPHSIPREEKLAYVEEVIKILGMGDYANAVVGVLGEGLNVEQRKRLTIGVELAAKPDLLLFLDEPTSGLDSQTAWSICTLMRKLADNGQAVLCTIHQPSAMLMQQFDRLLFLAKGGRTVYFGELGENMSTLIQYFENKGSKPCPPNANPAEWMLEVIGAAPGSHADRDWAEAWIESPERIQVREQLTQMKAELLRGPPVPQTSGYGEFATPLWYQLLVCTRRLFEQYWRSPSYLYSKASVCVLPPIFIGFTFWKMPNSIQGMQNQMFAIFMLLVIFTNIVEGMMPNFVVARALYEVRERPSKAYSWQAFMLASISVEMVWNMAMAVPVYFTWYYPIGLYRNAPGAEIERGGTMFLIILVFLMLTSSFSSMMIAGMEVAESASNVAQVMFSLCLIFNGVLSSPTQLPKFWTWMYHVSPFTYLVSAVLSVGLYGNNVVCSAIEVLQVSPPVGQTCSAYLDTYVEAYRANLLNPDATHDCQICAIRSTSEFLESLNIKYSQRWRNIALLFAYVTFNVAAALFLYWLARVPKRWSRKVKQA